MVEPGVSPRDPRVVPNDDLDSVVDCRLGVFPARPDENVVAPMGPGIRTTVLLPPGDLG